MHPSDGEKGEDEVCNSAILQSCNSATFLHIPSRRRPGWRIPWNLAPQLCVAGFHQLCPYVGINLMLHSWKSKTLAEIFFSSERPGY